MKIGIAAPIEIKSLEKFLPNITEFEKKLGIGGTAINLIIEGLLNQGHEVTVFTLDPKISNKYTIQHKRLKVVFGNFRTDWKIKAIDFCRKEYKQIKQFILDEGENIDIVNAHWSYEFAIGAILSKKSHIITFRDDSPTILKMLKHPYRLSRLLMDFWVRRKGRNFIYNSNYLEELIKLPGAIIPNPTFFSENQVIKAPLADEFNIFFVANSFDSRKNPHTAIKAFNKVANRYSGANLYLIGACYEEGGLAHKWAVKNSSIKNIHFIGKLPFVELKQLMLNKCHLMLHTSREESFGNNLIEAMSIGIPVIGGENAGAVPWVLDFGKAGKVVDINNIDVVADSIFEMINNKALYREFQKRSIENVKNRFTIDAVSVCYIEQYKKVLNSEA